MPSAASHRPASHRKCTGWTWILATTTPDRAGWAVPAALAALLALVPAAPAAYGGIPAPGTDVVPAAGSVEITVDGLGTDYVLLMGDVAIERSGAVPPNGDIPIEIVGLSLTGFSPTLGSVTVRPGTSATTGFTLRTTGIESPSDSNFDVFFDIDLPDLGLSLRTGGSFRIQALTTAVPFFDVFTENFSQSVPLVDATTGNPRGALTHVALDPNPRVDILFTDANLDWTIGGNPDTVHLTGPSTVIASGAFVPPGDPDHPEFNTEIIAMALTGISPMWGSTVLLEQVMVHSPGRARANPGPALYPADSSIDLFLDLQTSSFDVFCANPLNGQATVAAWPPLGAPYASSAPCGLFDRTGGQPMGTLDAFSWTWTQAAGSCVDADGDGVDAPPCGVDCDDNDPDNYPGNLENCSDLHDNNCNQDVDCQDPICLGRSCDDGDACTQADACQAGACTGASPVVCSPLDQCHDAGVCDPGTGVCSNPAKPDNSTCDDGDACTQADTCQAGACTGANPVVCNDLNLCTVDQCYPPTGQCLFMPVNCSNGLFCDGMETCNPANGACQPALPPDCSDQDACTLDACDESIDACTHVRTKTLLGTDGSGANLYRINPATGAASPIGSMGFPAPSIAADPATGVLYAGQGAGDPNLYTVDIDTGATTLVGNAGFPGSSLAGLAFDSAGHLYAAVNVIDDGGTGADTLAILDKTTGLGVAIGPFGAGIGGNGGPGGIEGIAFNGSGQLYGTSARQANSNPASVPTLYTIDVTTGAATAVGPLVNASGQPPAGGVVGLDFDSDGTLYGGTGQGTGYLVRINPATGLFTLVGPSVSRSLAGLAFLPCGCFGDAECGDGIACTTDGCNAQTGTCEHQQVVCEDGDPCTTDACDPANGLCTFDPTPQAQCNDGNACTQDDLCVPGAQAGLSCQGTPFTCDDGTACTADSCDPLAGCVYQPISVLEPLSLLFTSQTTMSWSPTADATHWNAYRGTIPEETLGNRPPGAVYDHLCFESGDSIGDGTTTSTDVSDPPLNTAYYFLISGEGVCGESVPGRDFSGAAIPNGMPCPTPP